MNATNRARFEKRLRQIFSEKDFQLIMLAYRLAKYGHRGQERKSGERYFEHPKRVALILLDELNVSNPKMIIVALLHDIQEDSFILTWEAIDFIFGKRVGRMVRALTKDNNLEISERDKNYKRRLQRTAYSTKIVKLADRLANLRDMKGFSSEKQREYIEETMEIYLPLAEYVYGYSGNNYLLRELKKLCFD